MNFSNYNQGNPYHVASTTERDTLLATYRADLTPEFAVLVTATNVIYCLNPDMLSWTVRTSEPGEFPGFGETASTCTVGNDVRMPHKSCKYQLLASKIAGFSAAATSADDWDGAVAGATWTADVAAHVRLLNQSTGIIYTLTTATTCTATGETARHDAILSVSDSAGNPRYRDTAATGAATPVFEPVDSASRMLSAKGYMYLTDSLGGKVHVYEKTTMHYVKALTVGSMPCRLARVDRQIFCCNKSAESVSVINTDSQTVTATITCPTGSSPQDACWDTGAHLWVTSDGATDNIYRVLLESLKVDGVYALPTGSNPRGICYDPNGGTPLVWIAYSGTNKVNSLDLTTGILGTAINLASGAAPEQMQLIGGKLYVACNGTTDVTVINPVTRTITAHITVGGVPQDLEPDDRGNLYVPGALDNTCKRVNLVSGAVDLNLTVGPDAGGIAFDGWLHMWVFNWRSQSIHLINVATGVVEREIGIDYGAMDGIWDGGGAWLEPNLSYHDWYPQAGTWGTGSYWDTEHGLLVQSDGLTVSQIDAREGGEAALPYGAPKIAIDAVAGGKVIACTTADGLLSTDAVGYAAFDGLHTELIAFVQFTTAETPTPGDTSLISLANSNGTSRAVWTQTAAHLSYRYDGTHLPAVAWSALAGSTRYTIVLCLYSGNMYAIDSAGTSAPVADTCTALSGVLYFAINGLGGAGGVATRGNSSYRRWGVKRPATANCLTEAQALYQALVGLPA